MSFLNVRSAIKILLNQHVKKLINYEEKFEWQALAKEKKDQYYP